MKSNAQKTLQYYDENEKMGAAASDVIAKRTNATSDFSSDFVMESTDVMTGDKDERRFLYYQLQMSMKKAKQIDIVVSFLMESGVRMLLDDLRQAIARGAKIRILTGNYLGITQPSALYLIKEELKNQIDLRFYSDKNRSFHAKAYMFHYESMSEIYIGSSNISKSALTSGIEWNYRFNSLTDQKNYALFYDTFEDLFFHHSIPIDDKELKNYAKHWKKPLIFNELLQYDAWEIEKTKKVEPLFQPRGIQIEALYALKNSREEGATKGLVQAATGVGKTYIAAFDCAKYESVLFVAHREEILRQAARAFQNVRKSDDYGFFDGKQKDTDKSVIFASVATIGQEKYLKEDVFSPTKFEYIIIDEFHHAVNAQYKNIIAYFKPKFLLGLTATPERLDGRNIYELCDYNVPYEISLKEAINKGVLVPFHYYGIYDDTDYSEIRIVKGKYDTKELTRLYKENKTRYDLIYQYYKKYRSSRAIGFCCSRQHANDMAAQFQSRGIRAVAVYSDADTTVSKERDAAIEQLKRGEINVIFCVDMFNEGVDIPSLDMVMFLRPTQSPIVFLQQLGRGLRTYKGKKYLNVLDFVGNYEKAENVQLLLAGDNFAQEKQLKKAESKNVQYQDIEYPDDCLIDFDIRLINLFEKLDKKQYKIRQLIENEYYRMKDLLDGKVPTRMELFTYMDDVIYERCRTNAKENIFKYYLTFLHNLGELDENERQLYGGIGAQFLSIIETTSMSRVYKMPILYAFHNDGQIRMQVTKEEVVLAWKQFFNQNGNWRDLEKDMTYESYKKIPDKKHFQNANKNPIHYLKKSGNGFFVEKEGYALAIREELRDVIKNPAFQKHMKDILDYRVMDYYRTRYRQRGK